MRELVLLQLVCLLCLSSCVSQVTFHGHEAMTACKGPSSVPSASANPSAVKKLMSLSCSELFEMHPTTPEARSLNSGKHSRK